MIVRFALVIAAAAALVPASAADKKPASGVERGKYLVKIAGCNDCHTPGYLLSGGKTPEDQWLVGDSFGWRGPWGTTYAVNLRSRLKGMDENQWLAFAKSLQARPPMPSYVLHEMHDEDLRAIYRYIRSLPPSAKEAPAYLPPDKEPPQPYALFPSPPPAGK